MRHNRNELHLADRRLVSHPSSYRTTLLTVMRLLNQPLTSLLSVLILLLPLLVANASPVDDIRGDDTPPSTQDVKDYNLDPQGYVTNKPGSDYGDSLDDVNRDRRPRDPRGWADPHENGGTMLDVSSELATGKSWQCNILTDATHSLCSTGGQQWPQRTHQHNHLRPFRSIHPY